jgi:hypothetical protein
MSSQCIHRTSSTSKYINLYFFTSGFFRHVRACAMRISVFGLFNAQNGALLAPCTNHRSFANASGEIHGEKRKPREKSYFEKKPLKCEKNSLIFTKFNNATAGDTVITSDLNKV